MAKGRLSVGDNTPTGEPENGPKGPYITDEKDDMSRVKRPERHGPDSKGPDSKRPDGRRPLPSRTETEISEKSELGSDRAGGRNA